eukprot:7425141-Lingulodinium_polyedra.AAC.1
MELTEGGLLRTHALRARNICGRSLIVPDCYAWGRWNDPVCCNHMWESRNRCRTTGVGTKIP